MYLGAIILLMLVLPLISVAAEAPMLPDAGALMGLIGKWFTFWGVGVRLFLAGLMQVFRPQLLPRTFSASVIQAPRPSCAKSASATWRSGRSEC
jgi:hypothetical protein